MKINIKTIAEKAGVSTATVSRVLNNYPGVREATRKQVLKVSNEYDYEINAIAKSLKQKRSKTIGLIIGNVLSQFYSIVAKAIEDIASRHGYNTILCNGDDDPEKELKYLKILKSSRVDGIILTPTGKNAKYISNLIDSGTEMVLLDRLINGIKCDAVIVDNINGSFNAVRYLAKLGYKRIGIICGYVDRTTGHDRLDGYKRALKESNIDINQNLVKIGDFKKETGYRLTGELLKEKPDAIFVSNVDLTIGTIQFFRDKNIRFPKDIAIIGFDDSEVAQLLKPSLTVVRQPVYELGSTAAEILIKKIERIGESAANPVIHTLNTSLIIRESTRR